VIVDEPLDRDAREIPFMHSIGSKILLECEVSKGKDIRTSLHEKPGTMPEMGQQRLCPRSILEDVCKHLLHL